MAANKYLDELISFGGLPHTRAETIAILQREGHGPARIDRCSKASNTSNAAASS